MRLSYVVQDALLSIGRNRGAYILAAAVQAICLVLLSSFMVLTFNVSKLIRSAGRQIELYVFLADNADARLLETRIASIDGIAAARYVSKEEALDELHGDLGEDASLVEALGENPLPASIRLTIDRGFATEEGLAQIERKIMLMPGIAEVWSGKEILGRLNRIIKTVLVLDVLILIIVCCAVAFIVFQTVESSIISRRHEIEIMELVGASAATVRTPFVLEGTSQGLAGGLAAFVLVFILYRVVVSVIPAPVFPLGAVLTFDVLLGAALGLTGSAIALGRIQRPHMVRSGSGAART